MRHAFTPDEANALLPRVRVLVDQVRATLERLRDVRDQLSDLRIVWSDRIDEPSCPDHDEYAAYKDEFSLLENQLRAQLGALHGLGCEVKDPDAGLVDFFTEHDGQPGYLCWRRGEERVAFWHPLEGGFAARQPLR